jgi:uncharacterized membrane protein
VHRLADFVRTTVLGGVLVIMPIAVTVLLLGKAFAAVLGLLSPVTAGLPSGLPLPQMIAFLIVLGICFAAGVIVRTGPGRRLKDFLDRRLLERIPGYSMVRGLAGRITGQEHGTAFAPALVEIEDALVPAFVVEEHPDGQYTIFVPSVPTPAAGTVYIIARERVHLVDVPFTHAVSVISRWGAGSRELLAAMQPKALP